MVSSSVYHACNVQVYWFELILLVTTSNKLAKLFWNQQRSEKQMVDELMGGCLCRAIRYSIDQVFDAVYCHCSMCRKSGGAPVIAWAIVKTEDFHLIHGSTVDYASSEQGFRCFCAVCGSLLLYRHRESDYLEVTIGTLDNPELVEPQVHLFADNQLKWLGLQDSHPRYKDNVMPHPSKRNPA